MAQSVQFTPIIIEQDDSIQRLGAMAQSIAQQKLARQQAVQEALLKQRNANNAIFGDAAKSIRQYYDNSKGLPQQDRDFEFESAMQEVSKIPADSPEYLKRITDAVNRASTKFNAGNRYFEAVESTIKNLTDSGLKINPDAVRQFANSYMYDYKNVGQDNTRIVEGLKSGVIQPPSGMSVDQAIAEANQLQQRQVKVRKDLSQIGDPAMAIREEIISHPELYVDRAALKESANTEIDKFLKSAKPAGSKLSLDPTGTKVLNIGTTYDLSVFDKEDNVKDNVTGLSYKRPRLSTEKVTGIFYKGGDQADVLSDEQYNLLTNSGKNIKQEVMVTAIENIRDHNIEAFRRAGLDNPEQLALSVSKNNAAKFSQVPGFANPFDEDKVEIFQRAAAADILKQSGRYDKDGNVIGFRLDRGVNAANPKSGVTVNVGGALGGGKGYEDAYQMLAQKVDAGKISDIPSNVAKVAVQIANEQGKLGMLKGGKVQYTIKNIDIRRDADGAIRIYDKLTGDKEPISTLDPADFNISYNNLFGDKAQAAATQTPQEEQGKVITKEEFSKMSIPERKKFKDNKGIVK